MDEVGGRCPGGQPRQQRPRLIGRFPKIHVRSRAEMGRALRTWRWLLHKHAEAEFGPGPIADEAVQTVRVKLLAIEEPDFSHLLGTAMRMLRHECERIKAGQARAAAEAQRRADSGGTLFLPGLGSLTGLYAEAVEDLRPALQETLLLRAQGLLPGDIALLLGCTLKAVDMRLYRARKRVRAYVAAHEATARGAVGLPVLLAMQRLAQWPRRSVGGLQRGLHGSVLRHRGVIARSTDAAGRVAASPHATATAALAAVVVAWAATAGTVPISAAPGATASNRNASSATAAVSAGHAAASQSLAAAGRSALSFPAPGTVVVHVPQVLGRGPAAETPDDVRLTATAVPPQTPDDGSDAVVAVGKGQTCQCAVLLQSLDGGMTWTATSGPPVAVTQLVLPPDYPADPRIFAGTDPYSGFAPYVAARFGAPFQPISALPAGQIAVSAQLTHGDPRLFVAALSGVWSLDLAAPAPALPHLEIGYSATAEGDAAALTTPPSSATGADLLAWTPPLAVVPGTVAPPTSTSSSLMACPGVGPCVTLSNLSISPWRLTAAAGSPGTVIAYNWTSVFVSRDEGRSFTNIHLPFGAAVASAVAVGPTGEVWVSLTFGPQRAGVVRLTGATSWLDETHGDPVLRSHVGMLVAVGPRLVLDALPDAGYRCTALTSAAWSPRCPAM